MTSIFSRNAFSGAALIALAACGGDARSPEPPTVRAAVETVQASAITELRFTSGVVRAANIAPISSRVMGNVTRVLVSAGDRVEAGQILAEIDDRDARAQNERARAGSTEVEHAIAGANAAIAAAEAQARVASATFERFTRLRQRGSVSAQEFEEVEARHRAAQSELERARRGREQLLARRDDARAATTQAATGLDYTRVRAPIAGIVSARFVDPGAQAAPGMQLFTIDGSDRYRVEIYSDERETVRPGDPAVVEIAGERIDTRVAQVVASIDPATRTSLVKIELPRHAALRSGAFARVGLAAGSKQGISVPSAAVVRRGEIESVFVVDSAGIARLRLVTLGDANGGRVEVLSGLTAGERIVTTTVAGLRDGVKVDGSAA